MPLKGTLLASALAPNQADNAVRVVCGRALDSAAPRFTTLNDRACPAKRIVSQPGADRVSHGADEHLWRCTAEEGLRIMAGPFRDIGQFGPVPAEMGAP